MKVYIFTEGGSKIGYGHVVRSSSLYKELEKRGVNVEFIINGDKEVIEVVKDKKYLLKNWLSIDYLSNILSDDTYAIVDSYLADLNVYKYISNNTKKTVFIDDNRRINYPKGIVVNPSIYSKELKYPMDKDMIYLLGNKYIILRDSFFISSRQTFNKVIKEVLITLGGSDIRNLTPMILNLFKTEYPNIKKNVIIGKGFNNVSEIKSVNDKNINYYYNVNGIEMKELMLRSDIAISAAGQTIYELIKTETPFIPISIIDNQNNNVKGLLKYNLVNKVLYSADNNLHLELLNEVKYLMNFNNRFMIGQNLKGIIDGLGSFRIINKLLE